MSRFKDIVKKSFTRNIYLKVISFIIAVIGWFIVVWSIDPDVMTALKNIPVYIGASESSVMQKMGLNVIDGNNIFATVYIKGNRNIVGVIDSDDISVIASTSNIVEAGTYELEVTASVKNQMYRDIKISAINPSTVKIKVDKVITKAVPVEVICNGVTVPDGYILEKAVPSVDIINITGPEKDVDKVDKCSVVCNVNKKLTSTLKISSDAVLKNNGLQDINTQYINLDNDIIKVTIPVLKKKILPVTINFINLPKGLPIEQLKYSLEPSEIEVAGPKEDIENRESINVAYIDMKKLDLSQTDEYQEEYGINIPSNFVNVENIEKVNVRFNMEQLSSKIFSNIFIKVPYTLAGYNIVVNTKQLNNVKVIGQKNIISKLIAGDVVAEVDINNSEVKLGQMSVPLKIYFPNKGLAWAVGDYNAFITITNK